MANIEITDERLRLRFSHSEKILGLLKDVDVPVSGVSGADAVNDALAATSGLRAPGYSWPRRRKIGTWRGRRHKTLVSVQRGQPALRVTLVGQRFDELLIGTEDAEELAAALRGRTRLR